MENILLLTDFSIHAEKAYSVAAEIAKKNNATLCFYHMVVSEITFSSLSYSGEEEVKMMEKHDSKVLVKSKDRLEALASGSIFEGVNTEVKVELNFKSNSPEDMIDEINELGFDLIVLGTSGDEVKFNSFAEVVVRNSKSPVVSCLENVSNFKVNNTLVATDLQNINSDFFKQLDLVVGGHQAKKTILYVNTKKEFETDPVIKHRYKEMVKKFQLKNTELVIRNADSVSDGVYFESSLGEYSLLALTTHGRKGFARFFSKSKAEEFVNTSWLPVFSYNLHDYLEESVRSITRNVV